MKYILLSLALMVGSAQASINPCDDPSFSPREDCPTLYVIDNCDDPSFSPRDPSCPEIYVVNCDKPQFSPSNCYEPEEDAPLDDFNDCVAHGGSRKNCGLGKGLGSGNGTDNEGLN